MIFLCIMSVQKSTEFNINRWNIYDWKVDDYLDVMGGVHKTPSEGPGLDTGYFRAIIQ